MNNLIGGSSRSGVSVSEYSSSDVAAALMDVLDNRQMDRSVPA